MPEDREVVGPSLIFGLNDRPDPAKTFLAAAAHLFAIVASILTAPLLIARAVGLDSEATQYVISASLVVSGIATFIQTFRIGIVGSGLLAVQGTSFAFIGTMAYAASQLPPTTSQEELLGVLLGTAAVGGGMIVFLSFFLDTVRRVITPTVTGVTICLLGLSLLWSALGNSWRLLSMASDDELLPLTFEWLFTLGIITLLATRNNPYARLVCVPTGLFAGLILAAILRGWSMPTPNLDEELFLLQIMPVSLKFSPVALLVLLPIFLVSLTETIGDITATSLVSKQPIKGKEYFVRLRGGVLGDGFNTILASLLGAFPNTTFSQNNAVIRLTGIASRQVGYLLALFLIVLGSIPAVSSLVVNIPGSVLNSTTAFLFAMIAYTGLEIVRAHAKQKGLRVLIVSICGAFGLIFLPKLLLSLGIETPAYASILLGFPVATGALIAIVADKLIH
jgi:xanthine permease XanP